MPDTWELASAFARFLIYFGVLASSGLVLVRIVFRHETGGLHRPLVGQTTMLAVLALLASGIGFALKGAAMTGEVSGMTDPEMLGLVSQTPVGTALVLRVAGLALVLVGLRIPGFGLPVAAAGGILAPWSFSRVGHVADAEPVWFEALLFLHLAGAAFWIGAVACLLATAVANKLRFVPAMRNGDRMAAVGLRRSIAVEWAAVGFILMATAVLTTVPGLPSGGKP